MFNSVAPGIVAPPQGIRPRLGRRVVLPFLAVVLVACVVAAALLVSHGLNERRAIRERVLTAAVALSYAFDQEVAAVNYLLKGLSTSPALVSGDIRGFYDQMKATEVPAGSWLLLQDLEGQVANTLRPYGFPLPKHIEVPNFQEQIARIRDRGWTVSGRLAGPVARTTVIALSLRINGPDGEMKHWITAVLSEKRLESILRDPVAPTDLTKVLYDRRFQPIVAESSGKRALEIPTPATLRDRLADAGPNSTLDGFTEEVDEHGVPILVAYRRSGATNWTATVSVPMATVNAPIAGVLWHMAVPTIFLVFAGGLAALITARQVERPLQTLTHRVTEAESEVTHLSSQLLALQEEERQRIARELHDSTAQHLVAANLWLMRLAKEIRQTPGALKAYDEIGKLLDKAHLELRVFTYLLHPPNLNDEGLEVTLQTFIGGFADRTGLRAQVRLSQGVNDISPDIQRSILRVVQEALGNVHRHAMASRVWVGLKMTAGRLVVRVRDNGRGMPARRDDDGRVQMGVGIPGMRARLQQFDGGLKIRTGSTGTSILAYVALSDPKERYGHIRPFPAVSKLLGRSRVRRAG